MLLIVFSSKHGQAARIAARIGDIAATAGVITDVVPIDKAGDCVPARYDSLIVVGSVHFGRHGRKLEGWVRRKRAAISSMRSAFISVSGAAATAGGKREADVYVHDFAKRTGWYPELHETVAGAEPYTRYGLLTRIVMRSIARKHGRVVDIHRDYEFTDWGAVEAFARNFIVGGAARRSA